ncbi:hypothetical protein VNO78_24732 [Psophocarpus tetragonolobus]|uniref:Uncharacterized protein n=1 Tax=Psophocarpus tetragonolobus TaxID=3891 RepID=A0AAN9XEI0_PSOTE
MLIIVSCVLCPVSCVLLRLTQMLLFSEKRHKYKHENKWLIPVAVGSIMQSGEAMGTVSKTKKLETQQSS